MSGAPPFTRLFDLAKLPQKGADVTLAPDRDERARIASWLNIESVEELGASVRLSRTASGRYLYRAHFEADVVQACVVTLEPVQSHLTGSFERSYQFAPGAGHSRPKGNASTAVALNHEDEDAPEVVDTSVVDIAAPVLEELSLALDPYPRRAGVAFAHPDESPETAPNNPFAILKTLKRP